MTEKYAEATDHFGITTRGYSPTNWKDFFQTTKAEKFKGFNTKSSHYTTEFNGYRYRCCLANAAHGWGIAMRRLPTKIPALRDDLSLSWDDIGPLTLGAGLTIFAGRMGCGKSTTLAATIGKLDPRRTPIGTLEYPIEVIYPDPFILQREVGTHVDSFTDGIEDCVRQNRQVIVISEIKDPATANAALLAASTGHSVLATLHADNAFDIYVRLLALVDQRYERLLARNLRGLWWQEVVRFGTADRKPLPVYESVLIDNEARGILESGPAHLQMLNSVMDKQKRKTMGDVAMDYVNRKLATRTELADYLVRRDRHQMRA